MKRYWHCNRWSNQNQIKNPWQGLCYENNHKSYVVVAVCTSIKHSAQACANIKKNGGKDVIWSPHIYSASVLVSCAKHCHCPLLWSQPQVWNNSPGEAERDKPSPKLSLADISQPHLWWLLGFLQRLTWPPEAPLSGSAMVSFASGGAARGNGGGNVQPSWADAPSLEGST